MRLRIKNTTLTLKIISWQQIIGGVTGIGAVAYIMTRTGTVNGSILLILLTGLGLFSFSIYSGKSLLADIQKGTGLVLSIINQTLQLFQWSMFGYGLSYSSGGEVTLGIQELSLNYNFGIVSTFKMAINSDSEFFFKINLFAGLMIFVLADTLIEMRNESGEGNFEGKTNDSPPHVPSPD